MNFKDVKQMVYSQANSQKAFTLLRSGNKDSIEQGLLILAAAVEEYPDDMQVLFDYAGAFDLLDRELEALPLYEKVFTAGYKNLPEDDQPRLFLQFGSTLRNCKMFERSQEILEAGVKLFPHIAALKIFLALTEYSSGKYERSMKLLLYLLIENSTDNSIKEYEKSLKWYTENLNAVPEVN